MIRDFNRFFVFLKLLTAVAFLLIVADGCERMKADQHLNYFESYLKAVDTAANNEKQKHLVVLDSVLASFPFAGIFDRYSVDSIKADVYSYVYHDYPKAILYTDSMMKLVEERLGEESCAEKYVRALYYKGSYFATQRNFIQALHFYSLAKETEISRIHDKCRLSDCNGYLANLLYAQGKYQQAAQKFLLQYAAYNDCEGNDYKKFMALQACLVNAGLSYSWAGMIDSASALYSMALKFIDAGESRFPSNFRSTNNAKAVIYSDQGQLLFKQSKFSGAESLFKKSIDTTRLVDIIFTQYSLLRLASNFLSAGSPDSANKVLAELAHLLDSVPNESALVDWYKLSAQYYQWKKKPDLAIKNLRLYSAKLDSIQTRNERFINTDVINQAEDIEQRYRLLMLKKDNDEKSLYLFISLLAIGMSFLIMFLIWRNLKQTRKSAAAIQAKNMELSKALQSLEQSQQDNTRLLKIVAHDLKNPISAIYNLAHILLKNARLESEREIFTAIESSCVNSLNLIGDLLDRSQQNETETELLNMGEVLAQCVQLLQVKADEKSQRLVLNNSDISLEINRQEIWRIMSNLINNSIKFSGNGSRIVISLNRSESGLLFSVFDEGIGIPAALAGKIFEPSEEKLRKGTAGETSYGYGLVITRKIVEKYGGRIWFESTGYAGSRFFVELPIPFRQQDTGQR